MTQQPQPTRQDRDGDEQDDDDDDDGVVEDADFLNSAEQVIDLDDDYVAQHAHELQEDEANDMEMDDDDDDNNNNNNGESAVVQPTRDDAVGRFALHNEQPVYAVALSPDGKLAVSGGGDDCAYLWDVENPAASVSLGAHKDSVVAVAFNYNGTLVATGGMDGVVRVLEVPTGALRLTLEGPSREVEFVHFHPSGDVLLAGSVDATAWLWDATDGSVLAVMSAHQDVVSCGAFTGNGRRVLTGSLDGTLKIWEPTGAQVHSFGPSGPQWHDGGVVCLSQEASGPSVATGGTDGTVCVSRLDTKKILSRFSHRQDDAGEVSVEAVAFCARLPMLVSAGTDARAIVWDLHTGALRVVLAHGAAVVAAAWMGDLVVTASADALVRVWDGRTGANAKTLAGATDAILDMAVSSNGAFVVTGGDDGVCRVWPVAAR